MDLDAVRASFANQPAMRLIGARIDSLDPGRAVLSFAHRTDLTQQDGFVHAGILTTVADSAGGYAGYGLMPTGSRVLSTDFQMRFLAPARAQRYDCTATVIKAGRTLTVCELRVEAVTQAGDRTLVAYGTQGLICIQPPGDDPAAFAAPSQRP